MQREHWLPVSGTPVAAGQRHCPDLYAVVHGQVVGVGSPRAVRCVAGSARAAVERAQSANSAARPKCDLLKGVQACRERTAECYAQRMGMWEGMLWHPPPPKESGATWMSGSLERQVMTHICTKFYLLEGQLLPVAGEGVVPGLSPANTMTDEHSHAGT